jgi:hypothetical protein
MGGLPYFQSAFPGYHVCLNGKACSAPDVYFIAFCILQSLPKSFSGSYQHFVEKYSVSCVQMKKNDITVLQLDPGTKITITYVIRWHCI